MKVLLLLGLIAATAWAYPVADSEVSTSTVVVDYSAVAKDSQSHEHQANDSGESSESVENSSEEKFEGPNAQPVKDEKEVKPLNDEVKPDSSEESKEDDKPAVEDKPEIVQDPIQDDLVVPTLPEVPKIEKEPIVLADKVEEPVEAPEVPVALPTVSVDASDRKEAKAEDELPKFEEVAAPIQPIVEEEIKLAASEVNVIEEQKIEVPTAEIKDEIVQDSIVNEQVAIDVVPAVAPIEIPQEVQLADALPANQPIEIEKKERKDDAVPAIPVQEDPITQENNVETSQVEEVKEEIPVVAPSADLPIEPQQQTLTVSLPAVPTVIVESQPEAPLIPEEPLNVPVVELPAEVPVVGVEEIVAIQNEAVAQDVPIVPNETEEILPILADLPQPAVVAVQEAQPSPAQIEQEVQEVQETQQLTQEVPQVEPVEIPEAPTFSNDAVAAVAADALPEQPVKPIEDTPVVVPQVPQEDSVVPEGEAPAAPKSTEPEVPKDLSQEIR